jgi:hypothetical protein
MSPFHRPIAIALLAACFSMSGRANSARTMTVSDAEALYAAVNDPGNAGAAVLLAAGHYALTGLDPHDVARPNGGRLELQPDMSLAGVAGHAEDVVIDASGPRGPSFASPQGNTGAVRIGRGHETIEWLTVRGAASAAASIATDLVGDRTTSVRIAHVIAEGSVRGIDVRNMGPAAAGRTIIIDLDDNELTANTTNTGQGIRFVNANGANGAAIVASLHSNRSHDNLRGCLAANLASSGASITIDSHDDRFDDNQVGCVFSGGNTQSPAAVANDNTITVTIHGGSFRDSVGVLQPDNEMGGLVVEGGRGEVAGATSRNSVQISVWGTTFDSNQGADVSAWGARTTAAAPAGTDNVVSIDLHGASKEAVTGAIPSTPVEPAGTNRVTIAK